MLSHLNSMDVILSEAKNLTWLQARLEPPVAEFTLSNLRFFTSFRMTQSEGLLIE